MSPSEGRTGLHTLLKPTRPRIPHKYSSRPATQLPKTRSPYIRLGEWEIRALVLQPGSFEDPLTGDLKHIHLKSPKRKARKDRSPRNFEAISYVWGPPEKPHNLHIPGKEPIPLTDSLYWALKYFRFQGRSRTLWADAICINQTDMQERNSQVAIMGDIYGACDTVLAWLGPGEPNDALAFATMRAIQLPDGLQQSEAYSFDDIVHTVTESQFWKESAHDIGDAKSLVLKGLFLTVELTRRTWFKRLWTAQEAHHNVARKTLICSGTHIVDGRKLHSALLWAQRCRTDLPTIHPMSSESFHAADDMGGTPDVVETSASLQKVVDFFTFDRFLALSSRACSDPRDRIFAVRKILGLERFQRLQVDYAIDPSTLYRDFITTILKSDQQIGTAVWHILTTVGTETDEAVRINLPSWVPDLHHLSVASRRKQVPFWNRGQATYKLHSSRPDELSLPGRCFAVCEEKIDFVDLHASVREQNQEALCPENIEAGVLWYATLRNIIRSVSPSYNFENAIAFDSFFSYPTPYINLGMAGPKWLPQAVPPHLRSVSLRGILAEDPAFDSEEWWRWLHWAILALPHCPVVKLRSLWKIQSGGKTDLAWLPPRTRLGDEVCYFAGSTYPFVVRPHGDGTFALMGDGDVLATGVGNAIGTDLEDRDVEKRLFREKWRVKVESRTPWPCNFTKELVDRLVWLTLK